MNKKTDDRTKLLRIIRGENVDQTLRYNIEFSIDIRGDLTIWSGMEYLPEEAVSIIEKTGRSQRVVRTLRPIYECSHLSPYTARIYQIEQGLSESVSDEELISAYQEFRQDHPTDGFGFRLTLENLTGSLTADDGTPLRYERDDKVQILSVLMKRERQDIRNLWGIDCPPDINGSENYMSRLSQDRGQTSDWFRQEFIRIGGDYEKLLRR